MKRLLLAATLLAVLLGASSCKRVDDTRIPSVPVNIVFSSDGMWATYGVGGALQHRNFIRTNNLKEPANFPFTANTYTGYGGVLLVGDTYGNPLAYDLACPYEVKPDIRVVVDDEALDAACPVCGSTYDVFFGEGRATSGPAADRGYGLTRYRVMDGGTLNYRVITNNR